MENPKTRDDRIHGFLQTFIALFALGVTAYTGYRAFSNTADDTSTLNLRSAANAAVRGIAADKETLARLAQEVDALHDALRSKTLNPTVAIRITQIEAKQSSLEQRMKALEDSLLATPATSLALPLMRKDLDTLRDHMQATELDNRARQQQSSDTVKWIFGLVAALITGVVAQWFGSRFKKT